MDRFERAFQTFMARGGFSQPCLSEDQERMLSQNKGRNCRHGYLASTCTVCRGEAGPLVKHCIHGIPAHTCVTCSK